LKNIRLLERAVYLIPQGGDKAESRHIHRGCTTATEHLVAIDPARSGKDNFGDET